jgi:hypothetical protein
MQLSVLINLRPTGGLIKLQYVFSPPWINFKLRPFTGKYTSVRKIKLSCLHRLNLN